MILGAIVDPAVFWQLVERIDVTDTSDDAAVAALAMVLAELGEQRITEFETHFRHEMEALDTAELRLTADQLWVLGAESWLHLRAWCISRGRAFVQRLYQQPSTFRHVAAVRAGPFDVPSGELLLYCMDYARATVAVGAK